MIDSGRFVHGDLCGAGIGSMQFATGGRRRKRTNFHWDIDFVNSSVRSSGVSSFSKVWFQFGDGVKSGILSGKT